uniref:Uncharacterized protein n=1 Tax=Panagrolaimus superbus TaxID=310955 RepID=A0A914Y9A4_9BILA
MSSFHSDLLASALFSKIYRYDVKNLQLYHSRLSYKNLKLLSTGVTQCSLNSVVIKYDNAEKVPMEDIIQLFSCDTIVSMFFANSSFNAFCKSYDDFIDACNTVQKVKLNYLPVDFNVHRFYQCLKKTKSHALIAIHSFYISLDVNETV